MICVLCGGVGAARFLSGLVAVHPPDDVTAVVNVADDMVLHGLHISPDLDTVTYTLAGAIDTTSGWGLAGETWAAMEALDRYGGQTWFRLGDRDLATHLYRTQRLAEGAPLSTVTAEIARAWGLELAVLPASDDPVRTRMTVDGAEMDFQDYFVRRRHAVAVSGVRFAGATEARPGPGVIDALLGAELVVIAPSNPIVSIGPLVALDAVADALAARRETTVAVSPIVAGAALKGPAARLMDELGHEASAVGVAHLYRDIAATLVIDEADADLAPAVRAEGMAPVVAPTVMSGPAEAAALARTVLANR
jgi:LPPG:FO 2-phospho-L-lactate transferase